MRVAHLTSDHIALDSRIFYKECRSLARAGYQVSLLGPHPRAAELDGVSIKAIPRPGTRWSRLSFAVGLLWREATKVDADLYHLHDPELLPIGLWLRRRGKEVIYDVHDDFPALASIAHYLPFPGPLKSVPPSTLSHLENFASPRMSAIVAADEALAIRFAALNKNCVVVHNLPQPEELAPPSPSEWNIRSNAVAYVGSFNLWRGLREMVLAIDHLNKSLECKLLLVGSLPPHLREEIAHLPGYERVQAAGLLDRTGVREILSTVRAGLVVFHPLHYLTSSWPIKLFEYMAAGIPVIASDFPLWRQFLGQPPCRLLVNPLDPKEIAKAIEYLITNPREAEEMGQRGRRAVEDSYNWSTEERALLHLCRRIQGRILS